MIFMWIVSYNGEPVSVVSAMTEYDARWQWFNQRSSTAYSGFNFDMVTAEKR